MMSGGRAGRRRDGERNRRRPVGRSALVAAAVVGLALASTVETARAAAIPQTLARATAVDGDAVRPGFQADFVGVHWRGPAEGAEIRLRHGKRWSHWRQLHQGELHPPGRVASELVSATGATAYDVRLPSGAHDGQAVAINTTDGPPLELHATQAQTSRSLPLPVRRLCYRSRGAWGADESLRFDERKSERWPPAYFPVQRLTVHHTATEPGTSDPAAVVRAIYRYHGQDLGFGDIGYHLLIDESGCVYEGRYSGPDAVPVYGTHAIPRLEAVNGGHVAGFNAGNVGVAVIGDYSSEAPSRAARRSLVGTLAALAAFSDLDPLGEGTYVNPINGLTKDVPIISGHRDWLATECPGEELYALLPGVRRGVAGIVNPLRPVLRSHPQPQL